MKTYTRMTDGVTVSVTDDEDIVLLVVDKAPLGFLPFTWLTEQTSFPKEKVKALLASLSEKKLIAGHHVPTLREHSLN